MKVTIHQPTFIPYLGVFAKILASDVFVIFDTAQYAKRSVHNRQRIRTAQGFLWLTIPLQSSFTPFNQTAIYYPNEKQPWYERHWRTVELSYVKTPFFKKYQNELFELFHSGHPKTLGDFNLGFIKFFLREFDLNKKVVFFSELDIDPELSPSEKLAIATEMAGGDEYLSGSSGKRYIQIEPFKNRNLKLSFFEFKHPEYEQYHSKFDGKFLPNMGAIDALLNIGRLPR